MFDDAPPVGYASGLYTDLRNRLVFYAAFESGDGVLVAAMATEGPMRTIGGMLRLETTQLDELPSIASLAANLVVDADARPAGRGKQRHSIDAAVALGFVRSEGGSDVLPEGQRCSRWKEFSERAGRGQFAAWAAGVLAIAPDLPSDSAVLAACERILRRWPAAARLLAVRAPEFPASIVDVTDDELPTFVAEHVLAPADTTGWSLGLASGFLAGIDGFEPDLDLFEAVDLVGRLPAHLHPHGEDALAGFDGAAALFAELRRRRLAPADLRQLFATFATDWTKSPGRNGFGDSRTAEAAADLIEAHVAAMARRFGVPAWLELSMPDFRNMSARGADSLVLAVLLALREDDAGSELAEVFLGEVDLVFLLDALRVARTQATARVDHVADVERNFRDAETAGDLRGRLPARLSIGGARRMGIELVEAGFGRNVDLPALRRGVDGPPERHEVRAMGIPVLLHQSTAPSRSRGPRVGTLVIGLVAGVVLAGGLALMTEATQVSPSTVSGELLARLRAVADADQAQLTRLATRREELADRARLNPSPCPDSVGTERVCGKFGDLVLAVSEGSWPKPAISGYVVEGRYPVEVFSWSGAEARNPSPVWVRHLLGNLDAKESKASRSADSARADDR